jgi:lipoate---protein ligase
MVWTPSELMVVIGKGSHADLELNLEAIDADAVPVVRRASGGCAVVLSPQMLVVSFAVYTAEQLKSGDYFGLFNRTIIRTFERLGIQGLTHQGISDIALNGRKVAGTAIYRNRELVFYHAILNLAGDSAMIEKYLRYPPRAPEYRQGRSHRDFVTSFHDQGHEIDKPDFERALIEEFSDFQLASNAKVA